jgi:membrane dipeptidase
MRVLMKKRGMRIVFRSLAILSVPFLLHGASDGGNPFSDFQYQKLKSNGWARDERASRNHTTLTKPYSPGKDAISFHITLDVADAHNDALLWNTDIMKESDIGHIDLPRVRQGNIALLTFSCATKMPKKFNTANEDFVPEFARKLGWPEHAIRRPIDRALFMAGKLDWWVKRSNGRLAVIRSSNDIDALLAARHKGNKLTGALLALEGAYPVDDDLSAIDTLYGAGFRMIGFAHFYDSMLAGSASSGTHKGLSALGRKALRRCEDLGIIIDLSHSSDETIADAIQFARRPLIATHGGARRITGKPRDLSDESIRMIADKGGIIGVGFWENAVGGRDIEAIVRTIRHIASIGGIEHIALGSDFDGMTTVPFDASGMALLTEALMRDGFTRDEIAMIMGGNLLRFYHDMLPRL